MSTFFCLFINSLQKWNHFNGRFYFGSDDGRQWLNISWQSVNILVLMSLLKAQLTTKYLRDSHGACEPSVGDCVWVTVGIYRPWLWVGERMRGVSHTKIMFTDTMQGTFQEDCYYTHTHTDTHMHTHRIYTPSCCSVYHLSNCFPPCWGGDCTAHTNTYTHLQMWTEWINLYILCPTEDYKIALIGGQRRWPLASLSIWQQEHRRQVKTEP